MQTITATDWLDFESKAQAFRSQYPHSISGPWYRGQSNSSWKLDTTLERQLKDKAKYAKQGFPVSEYYRLLLSIKAQIETFTDRSWDLPSFSEITEFSYDYDKFSRMLGFGELPAYEYMLYLRHHGFPSPLLDWTQSPSVAGFFAFRTKPVTDTVSIYAFLEEPDNAKLRSSGEPSIYSVGPNVKGHRRHFLQQSAYSVCVSWSDQWRFVSHESVFQKQFDADFPQDILLKFSLPSSERAKVLGRLETYNLNAFSLFGSEESLMETIATRALELSDHFVGDDE